MGKQNKHNPRIQPRVVLPFPPRKPAEVIAQEIFVKLYAQKELPSEIAQELENTKLLTRVYRAEPDRQKRYPLIHYAIGADVDINKIWGEELLHTLVRMLEVYIKGQHALVVKLVKLFVGYLGVLDECNYWHNLPYGATSEPEPEAYSIVTLISGTTGSGKTFTVKKLAALFDLPLIEIDCSTLTPSGYKGESIHEVLERALMAMKRSRKYATLTAGTLMHSPYIIYFDEFDKLLAVNSDVQSFYSSVQTSMLKIIESGVLDHGDVVQHYTKPFVILSGSFMMPEKRNVRESGSIGFGSQLDPPPIDTELTPDQLISFGIIPELAGRLTTILRTNPPTAELIRDLLTNSPSNPMVQALRIAGFTADLHNLDQESLIDEAIKATLNSKIGMRELHQFFSKKFL